MKASITWRGGTPPHAQKPDAPDGWAAQRRRLWRTLPSARYSGANATRSESRLTPHSGDGPRKITRDRYALSALRNKRADLASEVAQLERQIRHRKEALGHVDATLRLLDPSVDIDAIPNKRIVKRIKLFRQGELGRMIVGVLREAHEP